MVEWLPLLVLKHAWCSDVLMYKSKALNNAALWAVYRVCLFVCLFTGSRKAACGSTAEHGAIAAFWVTFASHACTYVHSSVALSVIGC